MDSLASLCALFKLQYSKICRIEQKSTQFFSSPKPPSCAGPPTPATTEDILNDLKKFLFILGMAGWERSILLSVLSSAFQLSCKMTGHLGTGCLISPLNDCALRGEEEEHT